MKAIQIEQTGGPEALRYVDVETRGLSHDRQPLPPEQIEEAYACEDKYHAYQELGVEAGAHFASAHARPHELEGINAASQGLNVSIWLPTMWQVAIEKHQVPDVYVGAFVTGFVDGMLYVWEQVKPRLVEALEKQEP